MDDDQLGEFAYDYVEVRRDYLAWTPAKDEPEMVESNVSPEDRHGIPEHSDMITGHSDMITGRAPGSGSGRNSGSEADARAGHGHTTIMGDRHGIAATDKEKAAMAREG